MCCIGPVSATEPGRLAVVQPGNASACRGSGASMVVRKVACATPSAEVVESVLQQRAPACFAWQLRCGADQCPGRAYCIAGGPVRQTALLFSHLPSTPRIYTAHPYRASTPRIYTANLHRVSTPRIHTAHLHRGSKWHIHTAQKEKPDRTDPALPVTDTLTGAGDKGARGCLRFLQCHRVLVTAAHGKAQGLFEAAEDKADQGQGQ